MALKFTLDPSVTKVVIVALLLFIEGVAIPTYTITTQNRWPTQFEVCSFILAAVIQVITYLLTFITTGQTEPPKPNP